MRWLVVLLAVTCAGAAAGQPTPFEVNRQPNAGLRREMDFYERMIAEEMRDPASVQFRDAWVRERADGVVWVCGQVNGKTAQGGFTGFEAFAAEVRGDFPHQYLFLHVGATGAETVRYKCQGIPRPVR